MSSGIKLYLDSDVCQRCDALRDPWNVADVYQIMTNANAPILVHPEVVRNDMNKRGLE